MPSLFAGLHFKIHAAVLRYQRAMMVHFVPFTSTRIVVNPRPASGKCRPRTCDRNDKCQRLSRVEKHERGLLLEPSGYPLRFHINETWNDHHIKLLVYTSHLISLYQLCTSESNYHTLSRTTSTPFTTSWHTRSHHNPCHRRWRSWWRQLPYHAEAPARAGACPRQPRPQILVAPQYRVALHCRRSAGNKP